MDKNEKQVAIKAAIAKQMKEIFFKQGKAKLFHFMLTGWSYFFFWLFKKPI